MNNIQKHFNWTPERVELLRHMWVERGLSAGQIMKLLNKHTHYGELQTTRSAVMGKLKRCGFEKPCIWSEKKRKARLGCISNLPPKPIATPQPEPPKEHEPIVEEPEPEPEPGADQLTIFELEAHHCRWIKGDGFYCGSKVKLKSSYCRDHHKIVYTKVQQERRRAVPIYQVHAQR